MKVRPKTGSRALGRATQEDGLVGRLKKRFQATTGSKHDDPISPNLLDRDFTTGGRHEIRATDVTSV